MQHVMLKVSKGGSYSVTAQKTREHKIKWTMFLGHHHFSELTHFSDHTSEPGNVTLQRKGKGFSHT